MHLLAGLDQLAVAKDLRVRAHILDVGVGREAHIIGLHIAGAGLDRRHIFCGAVVGADVVRDLPCWVVGSDGQAERRLAAQPHPMHYQHAVAVDIGLLAQVLRDAESGRRPCAAALCPARSRPRCRLRDAGPCAPPSASP